MEKRRNKKGKKYYNIDPFQDSEVYKQIESSQVNSELKMTLEEIIQLEANTIKNR